MYVYSENHFLFIVHATRTVSFRIAFGDSSALVLSIHTTKSRNTECVTGSGG